MTTRIKVLWIGVSRMSLPQAEPTSCARKPQTPRANQAKVPCDVR